jgi:hypothetical protein
MSKKITIGFERDAAYRMIPVHGLWGGVSPTGDIVADLYVERVLPPDEVTLELDQAEAREVERKGERRVRMIFAGLVIRPDIAYAVGAWLQQKARAAGFVPPEGDRH